MRLALNPLRPARGLHRLTGALLAAALSACAALPGWHSVAGPSGAPIAVARSGPASTAATGPTVVLQSGLGDGQAPWGAVVQQVSEQHPVFSYDRPGYGHSASVEGPRDPCSVATELHALLHSAGVRPPYLLVGHSLGGLYQHAFARLYPDEVAGLLLLDPTHPDHLRQLQAEVPALAVSLKTLRATVFSPVARREFDDQAQCQERLGGSPAHPVPTRLLASTRRGPLETEAYERLLERLRADWLRLTGAARIERVPEAGHYLQTDRPATVSAAIRAMARRPAAPGAD